MERKIGPRLPLAARDEEQDTEGEDDGVDAYGENLVGNPAHESGSIVCAADGHDAEGQAQDDDEGSYQISGAVHGNLGGPG